MKLMQLHHWKEVPGRWTHKRPDSCETLLEYFVVSWVKLDRSRIHMGSQRRKPWENIMIKKSEKNKRNNLKSLQLNHTFVLGDTLHILNHDKRRGPIGHSPVTLKCNINTRTMESASHTNVFPVTINSNELK